MNKKWIKKSICLLVSGALLTTGLAACGRGQEEIPCWGSPKQPGAQQLALAKKQADEMLAAHRNHPSIVCWGVGNELGDQFEACRQCSCAVK